VGVLGQVSTHVFPSLPKHVVVPMIRWCFFRCCFCIALLQLLGTPHQL